MILKVKWKISTILWSNREKSQTRSLSNHLHLLYSKRVHILDCFPCFAASTSHTWIKTLAHVRKDWWQIPVLISMSPWSFRHFKKNSCTMPLVQIMSGWIWTIGNNVFVIINNKKATLLFEIMCLILPKYKSLGSVWW